MFLTPPELESLTGCKQHAAQVRRLREMGIVPFVGARGGVSVTWDIVNEALRRMAGWETQTQKGGVKSRPNLSAVK